jgi:hypothetical protein
MISNMNYLPYIPTGTPPFLLDLEEVGKFGLIGTAFPGIYL